MNEVGAASEDLLNKVRHPLGFRLFLLKNLPAAYFSGIRIETATLQAATVSVPYRWQTRNPFRSTYFACLAMAAEMSSGLLAMLAIRNAGKTVSMLVVGIEGQFFKKATGKTFFTCTDGDALATTIQKAIATGEGQSFSTTAAGVDAGGTPVATFTITWSFKMKKKNQAI